jgi:hypothetical protein
MRLRWKLLLFVLGGVAPGTGAWGQGRQVTVIGSVIDSTTGRPIEKADVYLPDDVSTRTNSDGTFRLRFVPGETTLLLLRRIGYAPRAIRLSLQGRVGQVELGTIVLKQVAVALDSLVVETRLLTRNPRLTDFYRRKRNGTGLYITRQDIFKRNPMITTDLIRTIPGLSVECQTLGDCIPTTMRKIGMGQVTCPMRVLVDGVPTAIDLDLLPPAWIAGVEVYKSSAFTPLELGNTGTVGMGNAGCGTIVVWTGADDYQ